MTTLSRAIFLVFLASCASGAQIGGGAGQDAGGAGSGAAGMATAGTVGAAGTTSNATGMAGGAGTSPLAGAAGTTSTGKAGAGGSTSGTPDAGTTTDAAPLPPPTPGLNIVFPPSGAVPTDSIVVRGTSTLAGVSAIKVNGMPTTSTDGFATYRAVVPLQLGDNTLKVTAEGSGGGALGQAAVAVTRFADEASIKRGAGDAFSAFSLGGFVIDPDLRGAYYSDSNYDGVVKIDLATGDRSLASASESTAKGMVGKGFNDISDPRDITFDKAGHALLVDGGNLVGVTFPSGDRALLSGSTVGSGPTAKLYIGVGFDDASHRAIALDYEGNALYAIDPASGDRSVLSSASVGKGQAINSFGAIELDAAHHRAFTTRAYSNPIIAIDIVSGDRSTFSGDGAGTGPALVEPSALAVAPSLGVVFAWDKTAKHVLAVDLATGNRRVIADATTGGGAALPGIGKLAFGRDLLWAGGSGLVAIDPVEGHRVVVSR